MPNTYIVAAGWQHIFTGHKALETRWAFNSTKKCLVVAQYKERIGGRWRALDRGQSQDLLESLEQNGCFESPRSFGLRTLSELPAWADQPTAAVATCP